MKDSYAAQIISHNGDPGKPGHWKATFTDDGYYQFSNEKWPKWYMYMQKISGNIAGCKRDPGPQGKFYLMAMQSWLDGSKHYIRKKWSDWYFYVDDEHNVRAHEGCPGSRVGSYLNKSGTKTSIVSPLNGAQIITYTWVGTLG